jgi:hypothetical protein
VASIGDIQPVRVAAWIEAVTRELAAPSLACERALAAGVASWVSGALLLPGGRAGWRMPPRERVRNR